MKIRELKKTTTEYFLVDAETEQEALSIVSNRTNQQHPGPYKTYVCWEENPESQPCRLAVSYPNIPEFPEKSV